MNDSHALLQHPVIEQLTRALRERPGVALQVEEPTRRAAVALILRIGGAGARTELHVLLIKRATYVGDPWSGHIAFPGGRHEPSDATLEHTAIREAREEVAIDLSRHGRVLGRMYDVSPQTVVVAPLVLTPYFAVVSA